MREKCFYWRLYIKLQPDFRGSKHFRSVSIGGYTSNHNNHEVAQLYGVVFLLAVIHQTTTQNRPLFLPGEVFLLAVIHQTTTNFQRRLPRLGVFLLAVIHQTTTARLAGRHFLSVFLLAVIHQTTTSIFYKPFN